MNGRKAFLIAALTFGLQTPALAGTKHTVVSTYVLSGNPGTTLSVGDNVVNTTNVRCPQNPPTCTLALIAMDQTCNMGSQNNWTIVVKVDGAPVDVGFPQLDNYPRCYGSTWVGSFVTTPGAHKVQLITNSTFAGTQGPWSINYSVTFP
jgi:hypothetical protein